MLFGSLNNFFKASQCPETKMFENLCFRKIASDRGGSHLAGAADVQPVEDGELQTWR